MELTCPSENDVLARATGLLPHDLSAAVDAHVDACATCRMLLAQAAMGDTEAAERHSGAATFAKGEVVASRYLVVRWIGAGGMGEVYEVHDRWIDENVALKTIIAPIADDPRALARLKAEVRLARRVTHERVCRVYDLGFHRRGGEEVAFLTMELLTGRNLRQHVAENGPLSAEVAIPLARQMAEALGHAHDAGIVHRDFKSDNVMLLSDPTRDKRRAVVMDFGLARQSLISSHQPLTPQSRTVFGTLDYMSPEQVMGRTATAASDLYSLGIVMFEMLTGRLPFQGESPLARALLRVTERAPSLAKARPGTRPELDALVSRCLQLKPEDRFQSAEELLRALASEHPETRAARFRLGRPASLLAAVLLASTAVSAIALNRPSPRKAPDIGKTGSVAVIRPSRSTVPVAASASGAAPVPEGIAKEAATGDRFVSSAAKQQPRAQSPARSAREPMPSASAAPRGKEPTTGEASPTGHGDTLLDPFRPR